jgi:hypothetical protein
MGAAALLGVDRGSMSRDTDRYAGRRGGGSWRYGEWSWWCTYAVMLEDCRVDVPGEWAFVRVPSSMPVSLAAKEGLGICSIGC